MKRFPLIPKAWWAAAILATAVAAAPPRAERDVAVCDAAGNQASPVATLDGKGGAIIAWGDFRHGSYDIFAQHLLASGHVDPSWPWQGRALCEAMGDQAGPAIVPDGRGGAIVAWYDQRGGKDYDIYAQRILASGRLDPVWPQDGVALCTATGHQQAPAVVADGAGGAIVTWFDHRDGDDTHIYAQHVLTSGSVDPRWPKDGSALCLAPGSQFFPKAIPDGAGGAIVAWYEHRNGPTYDIYAQRVLSSGAIDPRWPADGRALCTAHNDQRYPSLVSDGRGGALVAWEDSRDDAQRDLYAQHVLGSGEVDPTWPDDGRVVSAGPGAQHRLGLAADGAGGAIVAWEDDPENDTDISAQHLTESGVLDPQWPSAGLVLCAAAGEQGSPVIASDGAGGAIVAWSDFRNGTDYDLYMTRVLASGTLAPGWPADGRPLCAAAGHQLKPVLASVAKGIVVAAWEDSRGGSESDVRALRIAVRGPTSGTRRSASPGSPR